MSNKRPKNRRKPSQPRHRKHPDAPLRAALRPSAPAIVFQEDKSLPPNTVAFKVTDFKRMQETAFEQGIRSTWERGLDFARRYAELTSHLDRVTCRLKELAKLAAYARATHTESYFPGTLGGVRTALIGETGVLFKMISEHPMRDFLNSQRPIRDLLQVSGEVENCLDNWEAEKERNPARALHTILCEKIDLVALIAGVEALVHAANTGRPSGMNPARQRLAARAKRLYTSGVTQDQVWDLAKQELNSEVQERIQQDRPFDDLQAELGELQGITLDGDGIDPRDTKRKFISKLLTSYREEKQSPKTGFREID